MDEQTTGRLATLIFERICKVCPDRNPDGSCDRLAEGACTLFAKLPQAAEAILKVNSDQMEPYIQSIRDNVCIHCDLRYPDGSCDSRDTDRCMLNSYLPLVVEAIEEFFQRPLRPHAAQSGSNAQDRS
jgi:hypothetical protein